MADMCGHCMGSGYICPRCDEPCGADEALCDFCQSEDDEEQEENDEAGG